MMSLLYIPQDNDYVQPFKMNESLIYTSGADLLLSIINIIPEYQLVALVLHGLPLNLIVPAK